MKTGKNWLAWVNCYNFTGYRICYSQDCIGKSLLNKAVKAVKGKQDMKEAYDGLTYSIAENLIMRWRGEEEKAMRERGDALKIFRVHQEKGAIHHEVYSVYVYLLIIMNSSNTE